MDARAADGRAAASRPGVRPRPLQGADRPVALGRDAGDLHGPARRRPQRPEHAGRTARRALGGRRQGAVRRRRDRAPRRARDRLRLGRRAEVRGPAPAASGRARARRADRAREPGAVDRGLRAARRRGRPCGRRALLRRHGRAGIRRLPPRLLPAALQLSAHERRDRPRRLEPGGADGVDARRGEGARPARRARHDPRAGARAGRRGGRVGAVRVRAGGLRAARRAQALPQLSARAGTPSSATHPRPTRTCGSSSTTSRRWRRAREGRRQRDRALLRRRGREGPARRPLDARPPDGDPAADRPGDGPLALQGQPRAGARRGRAGDLPRHARRGTERLELVRALDARARGPPT